MKIVSLEKRVEQLERQEGVQRVFLCDGPDSPGHLEHDGPDVLCIANPYRPGGPTQPRASSPSVSR